MHKLNVIRVLATGLSVQRVEKLAEEAGVHLILVEVRSAGKGIWINDFEISGSPGKVDSFFERVEDIRRD